MLGEIKCGACGRMGHGLCSGCGSVAVWAVKDGVRLRISPGPGSPFSGLCLEPSQGVVVMRPPECGYCLVQSIDGRIKGWAQVAVLHLSSFLVRAKMASAAAAGKPLCNASGTALPAPVQMMNTPPTSPPPTPQIRMAPACKPASPVPSLPQSHRTQSPTVCSSDEGCESEVTCSSASSSFRSSVSFQDALNSTASLRNSHKALNLDGSVTLRPGHHKFANSDSTASLRCSHKGLNLDIPTLPVSRNSSLLAAPSPLSRTLTPIAPLVVPTANAVQSPPILPADNTMGARRPSLPSDKPPLAAPPLMVPSAALANKLARAAAGKKHRKTAKLGNALHGKPAAPQAGKPATDCAAAVSPPMHPRVVVDSSDSEPGANTSSQDDCHSDTNTTASFCEAIRPQDSAADDDIVPLQDLENVLRVIHEMTA
ncbi:hypothetical protein DIPPA_30885 [Diplonema papillatum]|nr:hypothetical protein DIPPA_04377 [Diplonema papillatum]KAJ9447762.1 hypothetical protein DIPPA_30885 [Diplonema papillatum]